MASALDGSIELACLIWIDVVIWGSDGEKVRDRLEEVLAKVVGVDIFSKSS